jgi:hypothetical protein
VVRAFFLEKGAGTQELKEVPERTLKKNYPLTFVTRLLLVAVGCSGVGSSSCCCCCCISSSSNSSSSNSSSSSEISLKIP